MGDSVDTCDSDMRGGGKVLTSTCSSLGYAGEFADGAVANHPTDPAHGL